MFFSSHIRIGSVVMIAVGFVLIVSATCTVIPLPNYPSAMVQIAGVDGMMIRTDFIRLDTLPVIETSPETEVRGCLLDETGRCSVGFDSSMISIDQTSLAIGLGSTFLVNVRQLIVIPPVNGMPGRLVISPPHMTEYCSGSIGYIEGVSEHHPLVSAQMQIGSQAITGVRTLALSLDLRSEMIGIPEGWFDAILRTIQDSTELEPIWNNEEQKFSFPNCSSSLIDHLPVLTFSIRGVVTDDPVNLILYPEDYFVDCNLMLEAHHASLTIGRRILDNLAIIFDDDSQRLGFCDPN